MSPDSISYLSMDEFSTLSSLVHAHTMTLSLTCSQIIRVDFIGQPMLIACSSLS